MKAFGSSFVPFAQPPAATRRPFRRWRFVGMVSVLWRGSVQTIPLPPQTAQRMDLTPKHPWQDDSFGRPKTSRPVAICPLPMQIWHGARPLPRHRWQRLWTCDACEFLVPPCLNVMGEVTFNKTTTLPGARGVYVAEIGRPHGLGGYPGLWCLRAGGAMPGFPVCDGHAEPSARLRAKPPSRQTSPLRRGYRTARLPRRGQARCRPHWPATPP